MQALDKYITQTMSSLKFICFLSTILYLNTITSGNPAKTTIPPGTIIGAYYPTWVESTFPPSAIDTTLFTHIFYAFLLPSNVTFKFEIASSTASSLLNFTTTLHGKKPPVKALFSIAGGGADPKLFARMASDPKSRAAFISSSIDVARKYGFDGFDLDWEFPANPKEMRDLGVLFEEWRVAIKKESNSTKKPPLLLTAAVYYAVEFLVYGDYRKFPVEPMKTSLDWINVMCYDYHGSWDTSATGSHAALYDPSSNISTSYGLNSWVGSGMPRHMVVMGLPVYGRTWKLKDPNVNGIGAPAVDVGPGDEGTLRFSEIEKFNRENGATVVFDETTVSTYSYSGLSWIGYDDTSSTAVKVKYSKNLGLGGYFFWALGYDDNWKISREALKAWTSGKR